MYLPNPCFGAHDGNMSRTGGLEMLLNAMQRFQRNLPLQRSAAMAVGQLSAELKAKDSGAILAKLSHRLPILPMTQTFNFET